MREDVASLLASFSADPQTTTPEAQELGRRIADLLVQCRSNPYVGELMGAGRHPELADCRRLRFDIPAYQGKPRFRLIYRNEPSDGAPAECRWLAIAPRAGLRAHRQASQRSRGAAGGPPTQR